MTWAIVNNPGFEGKAPTVLIPACHDRSPLLTIVCECHREMHVHETQISAVPRWQDIATACLGCGDLLVLEHATLIRAFAEMRRQGWIE